MPPPPHYPPTCTCNRNAARTYYSDDSFSATAGCGNGCGDPRPFLSDPLPPPTDGICLRPPASRSLASSSEAGARVRTLESRYRQLATEHARLEQKYATLLAAPPPASADNNNAAAVEAVEELQRHNTALEADLASALNAHAEEVGRLTAALAKADNDRQRYASDLDAAAADTAALTHSQDAVATLEADLGAALEAQAALEADLDAVEAEKEAVRVSPQIQTDAQAHMITQINTQIDTQTNTHRHIIGNRTYPYTHMHALHARLHACTPALKQMIHTPAMHQAPACPRIASRT